jgi:hypothetical protein
MPSQTIRPNASLSPIDYEQQFIAAPTLTLVNP